MAREATQSAAARHAILGRPTRPGKELGLIYIQAVEIDATADPVVTDDADAAGEEIMDDVGESVDDVAMEDGEESDDAMDTT